MTGGAQHTPADAPLSPAERQAVLMMGEGHTAKSIAAELGVSIHAVNERLREARRKTGAGSSRELARRLAAQENRDKQIGVEASDTRADPSGAGYPKATGSGFQRKGLPVIISAAALAATAFALVIAQHEVPTPTLTPAPPSGTSARVLYDRLRAEPVDMAWAPDAERRLKGIYAPLPTVHSVAVQCRQQLCEVRGSIAAGEGERGIAVVADGAVARMVQAAGFDHQPAIDLRREADNGETRFTTYWTRGSAPSRPPRVVATQPAAGAEIAPGPFTLRVTFD